MKTIIGLLIFAALLLAGSAEAEVWDLNRVKIQWDYSAADQAGITYFRAKCGTQPGGPYTLTARVAPTLREALVSLIIAGNGTYACTVSAVLEWKNTAGTIEALESANSNEVFFSAARAGSIPSSTRLGY
jgi:hypothetical protein